MVCATALISGDQSGKLTSLPTCSRPAAKSHMPFRWNEDEVTSLINCERRRVGWERVGGDIMRVKQGLTTAHFTFLQATYLPDNDESPAVRGQPNSNLACHWVTRRGINSNYPISGPNEDSHHLYRPLVTSNCREIVDAWNLSYQHKYHNVEQNFHTGLDSHIIFRQSRIIHTGVKHQSTHTN